MLCGDPAAALHTKRDGCFVARRLKLGTILPDFQEKHRRLLLVTANLQVKTLGEHGLQHFKKLLFGNTASGLRLYIEAVIVNPLRASGDLKFIDAISGGD